MSPIATGTVACAVARVLHPQPVMGIAERLADRNILAVRSIEPASVSSRLSIIDDIAGFEAVESDWRALSAAAERPCLFLDFDWQRIWWQVYAGRRHRLHIVTLREQGRLVAVLPLYLRQPATLSEPVLRFIGTGESRREEVGTEYGDLLLRAHADESVQRARTDRVLAHLAEVAGRHRIELRCMLDDARLLTGVRGSGMPFAESPAGFRYRVRLDDGAQAHAERLGSARVRRIARAQRAVARDGGLQRRCAGPDEGGSAFRLLETLARARRGELGRRSTFESSRFRRFHRLLCELWIPGGQARLVSYAIGGTDVASLYLFRCRDVLHYYQSGFSPVQANRWMPLTLAHLSEMREARELGLQHYDLMRGEPPCYKDALGCERLAMSTVSLFGTAERRDRYLRLRGLRRQLVAGLARINIRRH